MGHLHLWLCLCPPPPRIYRPSSVKAVKSPLEGTVPCTAPGSLDFYRCPPLAESALDGTRSVVGYCLDPTTIPAIALLERADQPWCLERRQCTVCVGEDGSDMRTKSLQLLGCVSGVCGHRIREVTVAYLSVHLDVQGVVGVITDRLGESAIPNQRGVGTITRLSHLGVDLGGSLAS